MTSATVQRLLAVIMPALRLTPPDRGGLVDDWIPILGDDRALIRDLVWWQQKAAANDPASLLSYYATLAALVPRDAHAAAPIFGYTSDGGPPRTYTTAVGEFAVVGLVQARQILVRECEMVQGRHGLLLAADCLQQTADILGTSAVAGDRVAAAGLQRNTGARLSHMARLLTLEALAYDHDAAYKNTGPSQQLALAARVFALGHAYDTLCSYFRLCHWAEAADLCRERTARAHISAAQALIQYSAYILSEPSLLAQTSTTAEATRQFALQHCILATLQAHNMDADEIAAASRRADDMRLQARTDYDLLLDSAAIEAIGTTSDERSQLLYATYVIRQLHSKREATADDPADAAALAAPLRTLRTAHIKEMAARVNERPAAAAPITATAPRPLWSATHGLLAYYRLVHGLHAPGAAVDPAQLVAAGRQLLGAGFSDADLAAVARPPTETSVADLLAALGLAPGSGTSPSGQTPPPARSQALENIRGWFETTFKPRAAAAPATPPTSPAAAAPTYDAWRAAPPPAAEWRARPSNWVEWARGHPPVEWLGVYRPEEWAALGLTGDAAAALGIDLNFLAGPMRAAGGDPWGKPTLVAKTLGLGVADMRFIRKKL